MSSLISMGQKAKEASYELGVASPGQKNEALTFMAEELIKAKEEIIKANEIDRQNAIKKGITDALLDRLSLDDSRIEAMAQGLLDIVKLQDPVGEVTNMWQMPNGLQIGQKRVPIGVLGIIYESRPNVTKTDTPSGLKKSVLSISLLITTLPVPCGTSSAKRLKEFLISSRSLKKSR